MKMRDFEQRNTPLPHREFPEVFFTLLFGVRRWIVAWFATSYFLPLTLIEIRHARNGNHEAYCNLCRFYCMKSALLFSFTRPNAHFSPNRWQWNKWWRCSGVATQTAPYIVAQLLSSHCAMANVLCQFRVRSSRFSARFVSSRGRSRVVHQHQMGGIESSSVDSAPVNRKKRFWAVRRRIPSHICTSSEKLSSAFEGKCLRSSALLFGALLYIC